MREGKRRSIRLAHSRSALLCLALLIVAVTGAIAGPGSQASPTSLSLEHRVIDPHPPSGDACCLDVLALGDIDADGLVDIMAGSEFSIGVVWYRAPSWERTIIAPGDYTTDGEVADMDRDGDGDVVISSISGDAIEWWENTGDPVHGGWRRHAIGRGYTHDLAVGDIDGDGKLDVAVFKKGSGRKLAWYRSPAAAAEPFLPTNGIRRAAPGGAAADPGWTEHIIEAPDGEGLGLGDLDGDGDLDLVGGRNWYENRTGDGTAWARHLISASWGLDCRDILADVNKDGRLDIVLSASEGSGRLSWFENPGWGEHVIDAGPLEGAHSLEVGDIDGDGDPDVFTGEMHTSREKRVLVYENLGGGLSWQRVVLATTGTHNARMADLGGDGDLDLVGKNYDGPKTLEMWENVDGPSFVDVPADHWAISHIEALFRAGFVAGCQSQPRRFCPDQSMSRAEGAVFVVRGVRTASFLPPEPAGQTFADVPLGQWYTKWVEQLWQDGYTRGCTLQPLQFCPLRTHTRAEAAVFFERMLHGADFVPPPAQGQVFSDIPAGAWFEKWVYAAYQDKLVQACEDAANRADDRFRPLEDLLRAEAACMMAKAKDVSPR